MQWSYSLIKDSISCFWRFLLQFLSFLFKSLYCYKLLVFLLQQFFFFFFFFSISALKDLVHNYVINLENKWICSCTFYFIFSVKQNQGSLFYYSYSFLKNKINSCKFQYASKVYTKTKESKNLLKDFQNIRNEIFVYEKLMKLKKKIRENWIKGDQALWLSKTNVKLLEPC